MTNKASTMHSTQTEFELLQPGDIFTIKRENTDDSTNNNTYMKVGINQSIPCPLTETMVFGKSIQTIAKTLIINILTGNLEEYTPKPNDIIMQVVDANMHFTI